VFTRLHLGERVPCEHAVAVAAHQKDRRTVPEICAITGHSHDEANAILQAHYLHRDPQIAWNAIQKLEAFTARIETAVETAPSVPLRRTEKKQ